MQLLEIPLGTAFQSKRKISEDTSARKDCGFGD